MKALITTVSLYSTNTHYLFLSPHPTQQPPSFSLLTQQPVNHHLSLSSPTHPRHLSFSSRQQPPPNTDHQTTATNHRSSNNRHNHRSSNNCHKPIFQPPIFVDLARIPAAILLLLLRFQLILLLRPIFDRCCLVVISCIVGCCLVFGCVGGFCLVLDGE